MINIVIAGSERAADIHRLTQVAFAPYANLDPPSGALAETIEGVRDDLAAGGAAVAEDGGWPVGCLRWVVSDGDFHARRVAVDPQWQGQGVGRALMAWCEDEARRRRCSAVTVGVRVALPSNFKFYSRLGYRVVAERRHDGYAYTTWFELGKPITTSATRGERSPAG